jgi:hypothetical protein
MPRAGIPLGFQQARPAVARENGGRHGLDPVRGRKYLAVTARNQRRDMGKFNEWHIGEQYHRRLRFGLRRSLNRKMQRTR